MTKITRILDNDTYSITLPDDDRACLRLMIELQRDASQSILDAATHDLESDYSIDSSTPLTQFDYSGDHDDYNPAAAYLAFAATSALCAQIHDTAHDALIDLFNDDEFLQSSDTCDFNSPIFDILKNESFDDFLK